MSTILNTSTVTSKYELPDTTTRENVATSNQSATENMTVEFTKVRSSSKMYVAPKEEIEQTLILTNNSARPVDNIRIKDTISDDATFVEGSMTIDGTPHQDLDATNYELEDSLAPNASTTIKYKILVVDNPTSDIVNTISNITYDVAEVTDLNENSNVVEMNIVNNLIKIVKTSDKTAVIKGQTLLFQNIITNEGLYKNTEITFKDPIPQGTKFVTGSVKVDDVAKEDADPEVGFTLDDMEPQASVKVTFEVTVE